VGGRELAFGEDGKLTTSIERRRTGRVAREARETSMLSGPSGEMEGHDLLEGRLFLDLLGTKRRK